MELTKENYYQTKILSVSSVKRFAQNPARALADFIGQCPWSNNHESSLLAFALHQMLEKSFNYMCDKDIIAQAPADLKNDNWIQDVLNQAEKQASKHVITEMIKNNKYKNIRTANGELTKNAKRVPLWFHIIKNSSLMQSVNIQAMLSTKDDNIEIFPEKPLIGTYKPDDQVIKYKGKPNLFIVDYKNKLIDVLDFKISNPFDSSGYDWGKDITGKYLHMPIEWTVEKLFPWHAGACQHLLWENGYKDFQIRYHCLVITNEETPRLNVFEFSKESVDEGYSQFTYYLLLAHGYITEDLDNPPLVQDGSKYANMQSYKHPVTFVSHPFN